MHVFGPTSKTETDNGPVRRIEHRPSRKPNRRRIEQVSGLVHNLHIPAFQVKDMKLRRPANMYLRGAPNFWFVDLEISARRCHPHPERRSARFITSQVTRRNFARVAVTDLVAPRRLIAINHTSVVVWKKPQAPALQFCSSSSPIQYVDSTRIKPRIRFEKCLSTVCARNCDAGF